MYILSINIKASAHRTYFIWFLTYLYIQQWLMWMFSHTISTRLFTMTINYRIKKCTQTITTFHTFLLSPWFHTFLLYIYIYIYLVMTESGMSLLCWASSFSVTMYFSSWRADWHASVATCWIWPLISLLRTARVLWCIEGMFSAAKSDCMWLAPAPALTCLQHRNKSYCTNINWYIWLEYSIMLFKATRNGYKH